MSFTLIEDCIETRDTILFVHPIIDKCRSEDKIMHVHVR